MPLDPQVQAVLDKIRAAGNPEYWQMTPGQAREWHNRKAGILDVKPEPVFATHDRSIPGPAGNVPVRIYVPRPASGPFPVLVWLHGGGHVVGSLDSYDAERNTLFLNLEGMHVRNRDDVDRVRRVVEEKCQAVGKKVALVVNYDNFVIDAAVADTYATMVRYMETHYYTTSSRYTTSAFLRMKLGEALARRRVAPHIFETADEAHAYVQATTADGKTGDAA
jgi:hypothetical protein